MDAVCRLRGLQEELAVARPGDPMRVFGQEIMAASSSSGSVGADKGPLQAAPRYGQVTIPRQARGFGKLLKYNCQRKHKPHLNNV